MSKPNKPHKWAAVHHDGQVKQALLVPHDGVPEVVTLDPHIPNQIEYIVYGGPPTAVETIVKARRVEPIPVPEEPHREPSERHGFTEEHARPGRMIALTVPQGNAPVRHRNRTMTSFLPDESYPLEHVHGHVLLIGHDPETAQAIHVPERVHEMIAPHVPHELKRRRSKTTHRGERL
jgi:hypothetical protein